MQISIMIDSLLIWPALFFVALVVSYADGYLRSMYVEPKDARDRGEIEPKRKILLLITCLSVFLSWLLVIFLFLEFVLHQIKAIEANEHQVLSIMYGIMIFVFISIISGVFLFCNTCKKRLFASHRQFDGDNRLVQAWAKVKVKCIFKRKFECSHCGQKYVV